MNKIIREAIPYVVIIIVVVIIRGFIVTPIRVNGSSMFPTLEDGDILLLKKYDTDYERYDIVVDYKGESNDAIIKRVMGLPGDEVKILDGVLYINKKLIDDPYNNMDMNDMESIVLGDDEYFLLGDNRVVSVDSRSFGPVNVDDMIGTVGIRLFPFKQVEKKWL